MASSPKPSKLCASCGRRMEWRKAWARNWQAVKYCSDACRRTKGSVVDARLEATIRALLDQRAAGATICPSEAARTVSPDDWRKLMEPARRAARRLAAAGVVEVTQAGKVVDPSSFRGPIRIRKRS